MEIKKSYLGMIRAFPGGWDAMAAALGMSRTGLENRVYERKGQAMHVDTAMAMQALSNTSLFAQAVASSAEGVYVPLPHQGPVGRDELLDKFNELYGELGRLSDTFRTSTRDGLVDNQERRQIADIGQEVHRTIEELLALTFQIYCRRPTVDPDDVHHGDAAK